MPGPYDYHRASGQTATLHIAIPVAAPITVPVPVPGMTIPDYYGLGALTCEDWRAVPDAKDRVRRLMATGMPDAYTQNQMALARAADTSRQQLDAMCAVFPPVTLSLADFNLLATTPLVVVAAPVTATVLTPAAPTAGSSYGATKLLAVFVILAAAAAMAAAVKEEHD